MSYDPARVKSLFLAASDFASPEERGRYLDRACADDAVLRARVEALLAAEDRAGPVPMHDSPPDALGWSSAPPGADSEATIAAGDDEPGVAIGGAGPDPAPADFAPGGVVAGRYTLLGVLGEGGMGTVYLAEQTHPVRRQVALKLIRTGMGSRSVVARFNAERQALALMDHPNIARVFDAGATESGQPFFAMEYVRGEPITRYCDRHHLPVAARLRLLVEACQAVQHAHQKGIIHRDIKPSNVLIAEVDGRPTPKVIDFGVAKASGFELTDRTLGDTGAIVGTPAYMSPEQADPSSMDIDTRTDVYALGVLLYEMLTGSPPIDPSQFRRGAVLEMLRMVREVDPAKPSTRVSTADALPSIAANRAIEPERLKRELRGDLDWIALKALEKDRTRRYETANGLAADILRHLASEPVLAAPPSRSYRARKFVGKHRAGVAAAGLVLLALVAGIAGTTWGLVQARHSAEAERLAKLDAQGKKALAESNERRALAAAEAEKQAKETVEDVLGFVENKVFAAARPQGQEGGLGYDVKLADAIIAALPDIEKGFPGKPLTEARLRGTIGQSFSYLGKSDLATAQSEAALALFRRYQGPDHPDTLNTMSNLAGNYSGLGRLAEATKLGEEVLALQKSKLGPDHRVVLSSMANLSVDYGRLGRPADALRLNEEVLALQKAKLGPDHPDTLNTMGNLAGNYSVMGQQADGLRMFEDVLRLRKAKLGPNHPDTLRTMSDLASSYSNMGQQADALRMFEEVLPLQKAKLGPDHPETLSTMANLTVVYSKTGRPADGLRLNEEVLRLQKAKLGPDHPDTLGTMYLLAASYINTGQHANGTRLLEEVLRLQEAKLGPNHPNTIRTMANLAYIYINTGRQSDALRLREELLALQKAKLGPDHPDTLNAVTNLADAYFAGGREPEALTVLATYCSARPKDMILWMKLAALQVWYGRHEEFVATRRQVFASSEGTEDASAAERAAKIGSLLPSAAGPELDSAVSFGRRAVELGNASPFLEFYLMSLGMAEYRNGQFAEALATLNAATARRKEHPEDNGKLNYIFDGTTAFFRAMCLFRLGKADEARALATEAASKVKPPPADGKYPLVHRADHDDLILWLAYKEARALIGFTPPPAAPAKP